MTMHLNLVLIRCGVSDCCDGFVCEYVVEWQWLIVQLSLTSTPGFLREWSHLLRKLFYISRI